MISPTKYTKFTNKDSNWIHQSLRELSVLRGKFIIIKPLWIVLFISTIFSAEFSFGQKSKESWISTTENFLSDLKLMQGDKESFTPDTYFAPGGIICLVIEGDVKYYRPFGYSRAYNIEDLTEKSAAQLDPASGTPVKENSLFRLGSTSKMFVGLSLAICKNRGLVNYDNPISKYLNEFLYTESGDISLKQLFTHSGGLPPLHKPGLRERDPEVINSTMAEIIGSVLELIPDPSKTNQFSYSNVGVLLLAEVVSRVQPQPYETFVQNEILDPLGMNHTYFRVFPLNCG
jgi:CubicO group peptidase (beta-lactamase class C family)